MPLIRYPGSPRTRFAVLLILASGLLIFDAVRKRFQVAEPTGAAATGQVAHGEAEGVRPEPLPTKVIEPAEQPGNGASDKRIGPRPTSSPTSPPTSSPIASPTEQVPERAP